jgi:ornithine decarboxylase
VGLLDLAAVERRADLWRRLLPRVEPFYAVKCNPDPALLRALFAKWQEFGIGGFDCASPSEMDLAVGAGADAASQIVYANPCKQGSAVEYARAAGVRWVVFDNAAELGKLKDIYPGAELLLRVQTDDSLAQCPLSNKFGAAVEDSGALLEQARDLGLQVVGVSFHVGSGCSQVGAFRSALQRARAVFDEAKRVGFEPKILDIGGGFPGWDEAGEATFGDHARDISEVLEDKFGAEVRVIAEPGRFFAASVQALLATVVSVASSPQGFRYYLNDGVYGSFNSLIYDHAKVPEPVIFRDGAPLADALAGARGPCTVFGPTCDGFDLISGDLPLPRLRVGDRLLFPNMGAYTSAASTRFNGFAPAKAFVYRSRQA